MNINEKNSNSVIFLGDIAFNGILSSEPDKNSLRFKEISFLLQNAGLVFANLEVPIKQGDTKNKYKSLLHYSLYNPTKDLLKRLNIGCVSLANNHIYDYRMPGLKATISLLDELGIKFTGAGWKKEHIEPVIIEYKNKNLGFIAYVSKSTNPKTEKFDELFINYLNPVKIVKDIKILKSYVDKVILSLHWGKDYSHYPTITQIKLAKSFVDAGADIIMGHHTHTIQPYEKYNSHTIFYSLGGLTFGDYLWRGDLRALRKSTKYTFIPIWDLSLNSFSYIKTVELKGNYVKVKKGDYKKWSKKKWFVFEKMIKYPKLKKFIDFKEKFIDKYCNFFFGYYRTPKTVLKDLVSVKQIIKRKSQLKDIKLNKFL